MCRATARGLSYAGLADVRRSSKESAARLVMRHRWRRQPSLQRRSTHQHGDRSAPVIPTDPVSPVIIILCLMCAIRSIVNAD
jgi:hypothetical protein